ncbi:32719_t:CDS:2, partial [Gigaspora margarita]
SQPIPTTNKMPTKFVNLLESEIFNNESIENSSTKKILWEEFADWSCFAVGPKFDWSSNNEEAVSSQIYTSPKLGFQKPKPKNHWHSHI